MKNSHGPLNPEAGFTLVEVMISGGLLTIALLAASYSFFRQKSQSQAMNIQSQNSQTLYQIMSNIEANPSQFPLLLDHSGTYSVTYVGCFADDGTQLPTNVPPYSANYVAIDSPFSPSTNFTNPMNKDGTAVLTHTAGPSTNQICQQNTGPGSAAPTSPSGQYAGIEVHVQRQVNGTASPAPSQIKIHAMILNSGFTGADGIRMSGLYKTTSAHSETTIYVGSDVASGAGTRAIPAPTGAAY